MKTQQHIVIFGAGGKVGSLLVAYALDEGYAITAFVHKHHRLPDHPSLTIMHGDIYDVDDVERAIRGKYAVLSALGSWGTKRKDVLSTAMAAIIPAMEHHRVSRIISLTGAEARASGDRIGIIHRFAHIALGFVAGKVLHDGEQHITSLERSSLDWTVIRSPIMLAGNSRTYSLSHNRPLPWALIDRTAVARAMVDQLSTSNHLQEAVYIRTQL